MSRRDQRLVQRSSKSKPTKFLYLRNKTHLKQSECKIEKKSFIVYPSTCYQFSSPMEKETLISIH